MPNTCMKGTRKGTRIFSYVSLAIGLLSALTGICLYICNPAFLREIDLRYSDLRFKMRGTVEPNPQVAIVAIDEKSINELGRWPWSRYQIANLLNMKLRGWINYFGLFGRTKLRRVIHYVDYRLVKWLQAKHKIRSSRKAGIKLAIIRKENPTMFYHWETRYW